ncbi:MAG: hypothetical protein ACRDPH_13475 [Marmoricola sp.]
MTTRHTPWPSATQAGERSGEAGMRTPAAIHDVLAHATGRRERDNPVHAPTGGPAGNALLTAWIGVVLLVLFVAQLLTLFDIGGLISWHVAIGALLLPPALAKTGATAWRLVHYYRGHRAYVAAGPPPALLRWLGPAVVASTLALLGTGTTLVLLGAGTSQTELVSILGFRVDWVTLHQAAFAVWATATGLHVLARLVPALRLVGSRSGRRSPVPGAPWRFAVAGLAAAVAVPTAVLLVHADSSWQADSAPAPTTTLRATTLGAPHAR